MYDNTLKYSLDELEGEKLNDSDLQSGLIERCIIARKKKLNELTIGEIRTLLDQSIGLKYIIPMALSLLEADPLRSGGLYRGDLLVAILGVHQDYWLCNSVENNRLAEIRISVDEIYQTLSEDVIPKLASIDFM